MPLAVIKKLPNDKKRILYYALTLPGNGQNNPPLPVAEYLTNNHTTANMSGWLLEFIRDVSSIKKLHVQRIETDFSYALLHAISRAFNESSLVRYLNDCYSVARGDIPPAAIRTVIHICSAHSVKAFVNGLGRHCKEKCAKEFYCRVCAFLIDEIALPSISVTFFHLCIVGLSQNITAEVHESLVYLQAKVAEVVDPLVKQEEVHKTNNISVDLLKFDTRIKNNHFGLHFQEVRRRAEAMAVLNRQGDKNNLYNPAAITYLLGTWMPVVPLWTGIVLAVRNTGETHYSNAHAENWFRIVKHKILQRKYRR